MDFEIGDRQHVTVYAAKREWHKQCIMCQLFNVQISIEKHH